MPCFGRETGARRNGFSLRRPPDRRQTGQHVLFCPFPCVAKDIRSKSYDKSTERRSVLIFRFTPPEMIGLESGGDFDRDLNVREKSFSVASLIGIQVWKSVPNLIGIEVSKSIATAVIGIQVWKSAPNFCSEIFLIA